MITTVDASMQREPVRDVVLPSVAVDVMSSNEPSVMISTPIVISDDSLDNHFIGDVLEVPEEDWAGFSDLFFGLDSSAEGHSIRDRSHVNEMDVEITYRPTQVSVPTANPEKGVPVSQSVVSSIDGIIRSL